MNTHKHTGELLPESKAEEKRFATHEKIHNKSNANTTHQKRSRVVGDLKGMVVQRVDAIITPPKGERSFILKRDSVLTLAPILTVRK